MFYHIVVAAFATVPAFGRSDPWLSQWRAITNANGVRARSGCRDDSSGQRLLSSARRRLLLSAFQRKTFCGLRLSSLLSGPTSGFWTDSTGTRSVFGKCFLVTKLLPRRIWYSWSTTAHAPCRPPVNICAVIFLTSGTYIYGRRRSVRSTSCALKSSVHGDRAKVYLTCRFLRGSEGYSEATSGDREDGCHLRLLYVALTSSLKTCHPDQRDSKDCKSTVNVDVSKAVRPVSSCGGGGRADTNLTYQCLRGRQRLQKQQHLVLLAEVILIQVLRDKFYSRIIGLGGRRLAGTHRSSRSQPKCDRPDVNRGWIGKTSASMWPPTSSQVHRQRRSDVFLISLAWVLRFPGLWIQEDVAVPPPRHAVMYISASTKLPKLMKSSSVTGAEVNTHPPPLDGTEGDSTPAPTTTQAPVNYHRYGNFIFGLSYLPFAEAEVFCQSQGAHLMSYHNDERQAQVYQAFQILEPNVEHVFWLGLRKPEGVNSRFAWVDGSSLDYTNWPEGLPREETEAECVAFYGPRWVALPCHFKQPFACEIKRN
uniref:C-type lectin domain-containing protein n=1 Tax=Steinernema glaseri TaxID=37863 RepID=A0A1I7Y5J8_9BILA